jgi:hypothetical protein
MRRNEEAAKATARMNLFRREKRRSENEKKITAMLPPPPLPPPPLPPPPPLLRRGDCVPTPAVFHVRAIVYFTNQMSVQTKTETGVFNPVFGSRHTTTSSVQNFCKAPPGSCLFNGGCHWVVSILLYFITSLY